MKDDDAFLKLYRKTPAMMHSVSRDGKLIEVSDLWLQVMGYTREEVIGRDPLDFHEEASREIAINKNFPAFWKEGHLEKAPLTFVKKSGEHIDVELTAELVLDENNQPWCSLSVLTDVSKRNRAMQNLSKTNAELEESNDELERFAYLASHDLQEPLRKIEAASAIIHEKLDGDIDEHDAKFLNMAMLSVGRMRKLIEDLLRFSRLGSSSVNYKMTSMAGPLKAALMSLEQPIEETHAHIEIEPLPILPIDEGFVRQLLQNLVSNALKYRNEEEVRIVIDALEEPNAWIIRVADNGIGVALEHAEQIFDAFQRLHSKFEYPGTGIGLAIAKRIVERHGGKIWLDKEYQGGSRFCVKFPKHPAKQQQRGASGDHNLYKQAG